jgi:glycine betaine/proline transport system substrate-binding protein
MKFRNTALGIIVLALSSLIGLTSTASAGVPESTDPIKLAINEWTGQHITTHVAGQILEKMGYNVEYVTAGYYPQMVAIRDNEVTAALELWSSNLGEHYDNAVASGKVEELGDLGLDPIEAWYYNSTAKEKCPGLPSWEALKECKQVFATAETFPDGRFVDYPADWGTTNVNRIKALSLPYSSVPAGSEGALVSEIKSAEARKAPLVVMFWEPHWLHAEVDLTLVELPAYEEACIENPEWGMNKSDTYDCDWKRGYVKKMAWKGLKDKWPAAHKFLSDFTLLNSDQIPMMNAIDQQGQDIDAVVKEWVDKNEARWKPWTM